MELATVLLLLGAATAKKPALTGLDVATAAGPPVYCAGAPTPLVVTAELEDGSRLSTLAAARSERLRWGRIALDSSRGALTRDVLRVPNTGLELLTAPVTVSVRDRKRTVSAQTELSPSFACDVSLSWSGGGGSGGAPGDEGAEGGPGQHGTPGLGGSAGGPGGSGADLQIDVGRMRAPDGTPLALYAISNPATGGVRTVLLDPASSARLSVFAGGGPGGSGGRGGDGGDGGDGDPGVNGGTGGDGGVGGPGGQGGRGGRGGTVVVRVDARFPELAERLSVSAPGGAGGSGGSPGSGGDAGSGVEGGSSGSRGDGGSAGPAGAAGASGPPSVPQLVEASALFGAVEGVVLQ